MIRQAEKKDIEQMLELVWIVLQDMELPALAIIPEQQLKALLHKAMQSEDYRYSYRRAIVCLREGQIAGVAYGYKGELEPYIDQVLTDLLQAAGLGEVQLFTDSETSPGEWYLDTLVTSVDYRKQGVAMELLAALPKVAAAQGETIIGLNCDQENASAQALYRKMGYQTVGENTISGHRYDHMQYHISQ